MSALTRLKQLGQNGAITFNPDATVTIKDDKIDRAEVSGLLSVIANKQVTVGAGGDLVYQDGKLDPTFSSNLKAAWDNTTLTANATLKIVDGAPPQVTGQISALFNGADVKGGATLNITGADSGQLNLKLTQIGAQKIDATGSLVLDKGKLTGAGLTTNLVTQGKTPADVSLTGLLSITDTSAQASLKATLGIGPLSAAFGITGATSVTRSTRLRRPTRSASPITQKGGVWAENTASYDLSGSGGISGTVMIGAVPLTLGIKSDLDGEEPHGERADPACTPRRTTRSSSRPSPSCTCRPPPTTC